LDPHFAEGNDRAAGLPRPEEILNAHHNLINTTLLPPLQSGEEAQRPYVTHEPPSDPGSAPRGPYTATFAAEADALWWAVEVMRRTNADAEHARLQIAIALVHEHPPPGVVTRVRRGVSAPFRYLSRKKSADDDSKPAAEDPASALALLGDAPAGGRIICARGVYDALVRQSAHLYYDWQPAGPPPPPPPRGFKKRVVQQLSELIGFASPKPRPMECLYDDAQVLLDAPFQRMFAAEVRGWIEPRRRKRSAPMLPSPERPHPANGLTGLALSGGGMRSAVFSLGAVQALARYGFLDDVDYLSTVSGGGYLGASLTSLWAETLPYGDLQRLNTSRECFPFAHPRPPSNGNDLRPVHGNESPALKHVRGHAQLFGHAIGVFDAASWSAAGEYLLSVLLLWGIFLLPAVTLAGLGALGLRVGLAHLSASGWKWFGWSIAAPAVAAALCFVGASSLQRRGARARPMASAGAGLAWLAAAMGAAAVFGIVSLADDFAAVWTSWRVTLAALMPLELFGAAAITATLANSGRPGWREAFEPMTSAFARTSAILTVLLLLCAGVAGFDWLLGDDRARLGTAISGLSGASVAGISLSKLWDERLKNDKRVQRLVWKAALALGGYVVLGLGISGWYWLLWQGSGPHPSLVYLLGAVASSVFVLPTLYHPIGRGLLNHLSLNRRYSAMLQRTWVIAARPKAGLTGPPPAHWTDVSERPDMDLARIRHAQVPHPLDPAPPPGNTAATPSDAFPAGPYHLICSALNIPGAKSEKLLDRKSDSFVTAPLYSGSALTRWIPTGLHEALDYMPLAQAAAISGAAVSPNMGEHTSTTFSVIMTLLNVRLGHWLRNPRRSTNARFKKLLADLPLAMYWKEMLGMASHEDGQIYLSDGGHFENLGFYELLRRRCKYIIAVSADNGALDKTFDMGNLGRAVRLARVDFGIEVDLGPLTPLLHDPKTGCVAAFFAVGTISYPAGQATGAPRAAANGTLIFIKSGVIQDALSPDLLDYWKNDNSLFPYDVTTDQQFDQPQFESYRQLGYIATRTMCKNAARAASVNARFTRVLRAYRRATREHLPAAARVVEGDGREHAAVSHGAL